MGVWVLAWLILMAGPFSFIYANMEGDALHSLRINLIDPNNVLQSWDPTLVNPCTWFHVTCNNENSVIRVDLGNAALSGQLVPQLGLLKNLQYLELYSNNISGPVPNDLGNLTSLVSLDLYLNSFTGLIPDTLGKLSKLRFLRLNNNSLTGPIPMSLTNISALQVLDLSNNHLSGVVPDNGSFSLFTPISFANNLDLWRPLPELLPLSPRAYPNAKNAPTSHHPSSSRNRNYCPRIRAVSSNEIPPNALRRKSDPQWRGGFSLGVDLGLSRTGLALSKGFSIRPLTEVDEFIIGLPKSSVGKETIQSNKVRSVAGRLAVLAAERGWRVYLQDEHGTSTEAIARMINMGLNKSAREKKVDAYAAMMVLERYFEISGQGTELVLPKQLNLQEKLRSGPPKDIDFFPEIDC